MRKVNLVLYFDYYFGQNVDQIKRIHDRKIFFYITKVTIVYFYFRDRYIRIIVWSQFIIVRTIYKYALVTYIFLEVIVFISIELENDKILIGFRCPSRILSEMFIDVPLTSIT